jgi:ketosteroid isomerase-like protein
MKAILVLLIIFLSGAGFGQKPSDKQAIMDVLSRQEKAWNKGDIGTFMQGYWKSDSLIFIGSTGPQYGWNETIERYRKSYDTPEKMGQLTFDILQVEFFSQETCRVLGKWHLKRSIGDTGGYFTLIFKKFGDGWKIVYDHTS